MTSSSHEAVPTNPGVAPPPDPSVEAAARKTLDEAMEKTVLAAHDFYGCNVDVFICHKQVTKLEVKVILANPRAYCHSCKGECAPLQELVARPTLTHAQRETLGLSPNASLRLSPTLSPQEVDVPESDAPTSTPPLSPTSVADESPVTPPPWLRMQTMDVVNFHQVGTGASGAGARAEAHAWIQNWEAEMAAAIQQPEYRER